MSPIARSAWMSFDTPEEFEKTVYLPGAALLLKYAACNLWKRFMSADTSGSQSLETHVWEPSNERRLWGFGLTFQRQHDSGWQLQEIS